MQETTKNELRKVKAMVRRALSEHPTARADDIFLYYKVCKEHAKHHGLNIRELHFSTVFLGNPFEFPRYESVVRLRRMVQKDEPELMDPLAAANRAKKEADMVEYARKKGQIPQ